MSKRRPALGVCEHSIQSADTARFSASLLSACLGLFSPCRLFGALKRCPHCEGDFVPRTDFRALETNPIFQRQLWAQEPSRGSKRRTFFVMNIPKLQEHSLRLREHRIYVPCSQACKLEHLEASIRYTGSTELNLKNMVEMGVSLRGQALPKGVHIYIYIYMSEQMSC